MRQYLALSALLALAACGSPTPSEPGTGAPAEGRTPVPAAVETTASECQAKGEAYFREIESWPNLSDGRNAREVTAERCARTSGAFDGLT